VPPPMLFDLAGLDLSRTLLTRREIYDVYLPHRHEFMLLDGVCHHNDAGNQLVAFHDVTTSAWWVRGHVPGRPLLPGVLMLELAAHAIALMGKLLTHNEAFVAYGGVDECKFRQAVVPPARLYVLSRLDELRPRRVRGSAQGVVDGKLVFEAKITGQVLPDVGSPVEAQTFNSAGA